MLIVAVVLVACSSEPTSGPPVTNGTSTDARPSPTVVVLRVPTAKHAATTSPVQLQLPVPSTPFPIPPTEESPPLVDPENTHKPPPPTQRRHPEDVPNHANNSTPAPTTESPRISNSPEPEGRINACYALNNYDSTVEEPQSFHWCSQAIMDDVAEKCRGAGNSVLELACAETRLANAQMFIMRESLFKCMATSQKKDRLACRSQTAATVNGHISLYWGIRAEVITAVDSTSEVKEQKNAAVDCVAKKGLRRPNPDEPFRWQESKPPCEYKPLLQLPDDEPARAIQGLEALDDCAQSVGLYPLQEDAWLAEIRRLKEKDPGKVRPLLDNGIIAALEADGVAVFLTPNR